MCSHMFMYTHSLQNTKEECELYEKSVASVRCHTLSCGDKTCVQSQGNVVTLLKCSFMLRKQSEHILRHLMFIPNSCYISGLPEQKQYFDNLVEQKLSKYTIPRHGLYIFPHFQVSLQKWPDCEH